MPCVMESNTRYHSIGLKVTKEQESNFGIGSQMPDGQERIQGEG